MSKFTDAKERTWEIPHFDPINTADVFQATNVSIYTLTAGKMEGLKDLFSNFPVFGNVLYLLVKEQARERGVDEKSFMQGLVGGEAVESAIEAFWQEVLFFSPKKQRELLIRMRQQMELIATENPVTDQKLKAGLIAGLKKMYGDSLELRDSPPEA